MNQASQPHISKPITLLEAAQDELKNAEQFALQPLDLLQANFVASAPDKQDSPAKKRRTTDAPLEDEIKPEMSAV